MTRCVSCAVALIVLVASTGVRSLGQAGAADEALVTRARAIHERVIALDTHADINPENFTRQKNYTQRLETQVNLPKMVEGGLDASFFIVYVGQGELTPAGMVRCARAKSSSLRLMSVLESMLKSGWRRRSLRRRG